MIGIGRKKEVTVGIGHGRNWCKVTTTKKYSRFDLGKLHWAFQDATRARENKRQEQERGTKSGGRAVAGGAVNRYP